MSIIVAIKDKDTIYLGADTLTLAGSLAYNKTKIESNFKINKINGDILVGNVGLTSIKQFWQKNKKLFDKLPEEGLTKEFLVTNVIPKIRRDLIEAEIVKEDEKNPNNFFIACKDKLFVVDDDFGVFEINKYLAIGAGREFGLCYLSDETKSIRDRLLLSIKHSAKFLNCVGLPAVLINTKDMEFELVEEVEE